MIFSTHCARTRDRRFEPNDTFMIESLLTSALSVLFGVLAILSIFGTIRSVMLGTSDLREGRRSGQGIVALARGELPNGRERAQLDLANGVNSKVNRRGGITYRKKARAFW